MTQIFVAGSIVMGFAGITSLQDNTTLFGVIPLVILGLALFCYAAVGIISFIHLRIQNMRRSIHADALWPDYWSDDVQTIKHALVHDISEAYAYNKTVLEKKSVRLHGGLTLQAHSLPDAICFPSTRSGDCGLTPPPTDGLLLSLTLA